MKKNNLIKNISVIDLFCGIGGLSYGLKKAGLKVKAGVDIDETCKYAYEENCDSKFIHKSIKEINGLELLKFYSKNDIRVLVGCAPCQPFSSYTYKADKGEDKRWELLYEFARLIEETEPTIVSMENVPTLLNFKEAPVFLDFTEKLKNLGYKVWFKVVYSPDYGIPQKRKRLVLLASKLGEISLIKPTHLPNQYLTVKDVIGNLEKISAGEVSSTDFIHKAAKLSAKNIDRIKQSKPGGSWKRDWDENLKLNCHNTDKGKTYVSVYGRMKWDEPAPTMTTFCTGIGNGRFGHPEQNRAISLREAAIIQSFPLDYKFAESAEKLKFGKVSKHIGNAVPPKLGEVIGKSIISHLQEYYNG